ncbi:MAG: hypothetical protein LBB94_02295 [Clostridiales bacterium]|nr:hypothetical protein [Clostridiales bacterium]
MPVRTGEAMERFNINDILRLPRLRTAINIYAEKCGLNWARTIRAPVIRAIIAVR